MPSPAWLERGTPAGWVQKEGRGFGVLPWGWGAGPCAGATREEGRKELGCLIYHAPSQLPALSVNPSCTLAVRHEFICVTKLRVFLLGTWIQTQRFRAPSPPALSSAAAPQGPCRCGAPACSPSELERHRGWVPACVSAELL